jgi:hypothetical protein
VKIGLKHKRSKKKNNENLKNDGDPVVYLLAYDCELGMTNLELGMTNLELNQRNGTLKLSESQRNGTCDLGGDGLLRVWEATGC